MGSSTNDKAVIEGLWRPVNWECVYLNLAIDDQRLYDQRLYEQLSAYCTYSNHPRPHQELNGQKPPQVFA